MVVETVAQTSSNRRIFRTVARLSSGETFEPGHDELIFFGLVGGKVVAVSCYEPAAADFPVDVLTPPTDVSSGHAHCVSYVFVQPSVQRHGYGSSMLSAMEADMERRVANRPLRLQASRKAVQFFEKLGYEQVGSPSKPVCPGSPLFSTLYPMEKWRLR